MDERNTRTHVVDGVTVTVTGSGNRRLAAEYEGCCYRVAVSGDRFVLRSVSGDECRTGDIPLMLEAIFATALIRDGD